MAGGTADDTAVYGQGRSGNPADITNAGGLSPLGTMAQGGNVREMTEEQAIFGGSWESIPTRLSATYNGDQYRGENYDLGFGVVTIIPEPSAVCMTLIGLMGVLLRRRRE